MKYTRIVVALAFIFYFLGFFSSHAMAVEEKSGDVIEKRPLNSKPDEFEGFDQFDEFKEKPAVNVFDPLSPYNRFMTRVNDKLYFWVLKPVARGYAKIVNEPVRLAINRFFKNIYFPVRGVNNLLQLKFKRAGIEAARFGINTTIGFFGFFDPAKILWSLKSYPEDFGQTLGYYGVKSGFPVVLPLLGPSNLRDACGKIPDLYLSPVFYYNNAYPALGISSGVIVNRVSLHRGEYESLRKDAIDLYLFLQNAYEQNREKQIEE